MAVFLAVILITVTVFLIGRRGEQVTIPPALTPGIPSARTEIPKELFSNEAFLNLESYSILQLPANIGRDNPFAP